MAVFPFPSLGRRLARPALSGIILASCALPALAADFPEPVPYGPPRDAYGERRPPPPPPVEEPGLDRGPVRPLEPCRTVIRRRVTPYGEEIVKRVTICEERSDRLRFEPEPRSGPEGPPRWLPPRDLPPAYGHEGRLERRHGDVEGRADEEPRGDEPSPDEPSYDGRGPERRY